MSKDKERKNGSGAAVGEMEPHASDRPDGRRTVPARRETAAPAPWAGGDPFGFVRQFAGEMERLFDSFGLGSGPASRGFGLAPGAWAPQIEVFPSGDQVVVRADLPGLNKDDVRVEITDDAVTIRGERRREQEEHREGYYRSERSYGSFIRTIPLPDGVAADRAAASFRDGVLEVTIPAPRQEERRGRQIEIKG
jgi:HSP20 family protein